MESDGRWNLFVYMPHTPVLILLNDGNLKVVLL